MYIVFLATSFFFSFFSLTTFFLNEEENYLTTFLYLAYSSYLRCICTTCEVHILHVGGSFDSNR